MKRKTILMVDSEAATRHILRVALEVADYNCLEAKDAQEARCLLIDVTPDLVLLDWMLPDISGTELTQRLKRNKATAKVPIVMLTANSDEDRKIKGLAAGAEDCISKPFSPRELVARLNAILRRTAPAEEPEPLRLNGLCLDASNHRVTINGLAVHVGPTEYRLLKFLLLHQERAYTRRELLDYVWGDDVFVEERTVDVHIRRLRQALAYDGHERYIQTVRGIGYRLSGTLLIPA